MFKNVNFPSLGISGRQSELIELTLSFGFKGFDLDLADFKKQVEFQGLDKARRLLDSARLNLGCFELPVEWQQDEETFQNDLNELPALVELAAGLGGTRCRTPLEPASDLMPYHESFEIYRRRLNEIAEVLAGFEVRLGLDLVATADRRDDRAFQFIHTFDAMLMLAKSVGAANVGVCLDAWQWHVAGGTMEQIAALSAGDLIAVDLSDATTLAGEDRVDESTRVLPGENGTIDCAALLAAVAQLGFDGPVTPKPHATCFEGATRDARVRASGESLDKVWTAAGLNKRGKLVAQ